MMYSFSKEMKSSAASILFILISTFSFYSCTKLDTTTLGGDFIPGSDKLITDTLNVSVTTTSSINPDTTIIDKTAQHVLGFLNDPMFGTTTGSIFLQMLPPIYPFFYPVGKDSLFLDSLVLSLAYNGSFGDTNAVSKVNVYRITDPNFKPGKRYKVSEDVSFSPANFLGTRSVKASDLRRGYKLAYRADSVFDVLRIRLDDALGTALLKENTSTGFLRNDSAFKAFLNGLAIIPDSTSSGSVMNYFTPNNPLTRLNLYFRYRKTDGTLDTTFTAFTFVPDTIRSANANKIYRNYSSGSALPVLTSNSPASLAYLQTAPGTSVLVKAPGLNNLVGNRYIVHKAELVVRQIYQGPLSIENQFIQPVLHLYTLDNLGNHQSIPFDSIRYFIPSSYNQVRNVFTYNIVEDNAGGTPSYFTNITNNQVVEYRMNVTRYVQNIINGKATLRDFKLDAPYFAEFKAPIDFPNFNITSTININPLAFGRVQVGGGSHPTYPMFVRIYYSKQ